MWEAPGSWEMVYHKIAKAVANLTKLDFSYCGLLLTERNGVLISYVLSVPTTFSVNAYSTLVSIIATTRDKRHQADW